MNVYVANSRAPWLARTRRRRLYPPDNTQERDTVHVEPGFRVHYVTAGQPPRSIAKVSPTTSRVTDSVATLFRCHGTPDAIHANYWLSGLAGHRLKHELSIPLIMTFHTLERVKADLYEGESEDRALQEAAIFACADAGARQLPGRGRTVRALYIRRSARVHVVPLGVEHAFFAPGYRPQARRASASRVRTRCCSSSVASRP